MTPRSTDDDADESTATGLGCDRPASSDAPAGRTDHSRDARQDTNERTVTERSGHAGSERTGRARPLGRRAFVSGLGALGVAALAGCTGDGSDPQAGGGGSNTETDTKTQGGGDVPDSTEADTDDGGETDAATGTPTESIHEDIELRQPESYIVESDFEDFTLVAEIHGDDMRADHDGVVVYEVDGVTYSVTDDLCIEYDDGGEASSDADVPEYGPDSLQPAGTDTLDGEVMALYTIELPAHGESNYYVDPETGYPRRMEAESGVWEWHSFGEVPPIEAPDMDCFSEDDY